MINSKLYIAVLDDVPDFIVPTLVAHTMLGAHLEFSNEFYKNQDTDLAELYSQYFTWLKVSFKKCVVRVNKKEFNKIANIPYTYLGHENKTLGGVKSCAIPIPVQNSNLPKVLKFSKLWSPKTVDSNCDG